MTPNFDRLPPLAERAHVKLKGRGSAERDLRELGMSGAQHDIPFAENRRERNKQYSALPAENPLVAKSAQ